MTNEEKAREIIGGDCKKENCLQCGGSLSVDVGCAEYRKIMEMAQWKDEQFKHLLIEKTKLLSSSAAQDSVKRCTIEEIYRELFNEEIPNSNPYIK